MRPDRRRRGAREGSHRARHAHPRAAARVPRPARRDGDHRARSTERTRGAARLTTVRTPCGEPRKQDAAKRTVVYGWVDRRRDLGGLVFIDLRDRSGLLQCVFNPKTAPEAHAPVEKLPLEWVLRVEGELRPRDPQNVNPRLDTGEVELHVEKCEVLSAAKTPPFAVNEDAVVDETLRLRYRYLDLRRPTLQRNMVARARFLQALRHAMVEQGFLEIET